MTQPSTIPLEDAVRQIELVCRRLGLLHLAFSDVLIEEYGDEMGRRLIIRAIKKYGCLIGEAKRKKAIADGLPLTPEAMAKYRDIPTIGMHRRAESVEVDGERRRRAYGCVMAKVWHEYGRDDVGRLYCFVDPASAMTFNPDFKTAHTRAEPDGDPYCELVNRPTTEKDRSEIEKQDPDWEAIDRC
ncbi:MAG: L-2-amino-thiazoline-4-carboxylic acid hydrolase [Chloroflexota bacterium]